MGSVVETGNGASSGVDTGAGEFWTGEMYCARETYERPETDRA